MRLGHSTHSLGYPVGAHSRFHFAQPGLEFYDWLVGKRLTLKREPPPEAKQETPAHQGNSNVNDEGYHPSDSRRAAISFSYSSSIWMDAHSRVVGSKMTDSPVNIASKCWRTTARPLPGISRITTRVSETRGSGWDSSLMRSLGLAIGDNLPEFCYEVKP